METVLLKIPVVIARLAVGPTKVYELTSSGREELLSTGRGCVPTKQ